MIERILEALGASFHRHWAVWLLALTWLFLLFPGLDLWVSGLFYDPGAGWVYARGWFAEFVRKGLPTVMIGALLFTVFLWGAGLIYRQRFLGIDGRVTAFLVSSLAIGPGLIVNSLLKENWGRGRPNDMLVFGGEFPYAPPGMIVDQCVSNCSFTSGHGALGFWAVAFAFLVPKRHRAEAVAVALLFGLMVSFVRIVQGGHFLSDTIWSAVIVLTVTWALHRLILGKR